MAMLPTFQEARAGGMLKSRSLSSPSVTQRWAWPLGVSWGQVHISPSLFFTHPPCHEMSFYFLVPSQHVTENESHGVFLRWAEVVYPFYGRETETRWEASWAQAPHTHDAFSTSHFLPVKPSVR